MKDPELTKAAVRDFWNAAPCGTRDLISEEERARFAEIEQRRDHLEPEIARHARFSARRGVRMLEVGVGAGTDHLRFARAGAVCSGVDLTDAAIDMTRRRLKSEGLESDLRVADAERLPFPDGSFDFVYSWGVIHHTPDTARAAQEILRVLRPGGEFCVMVYNRRSLVALQAWLRFGVLAGRPMQPIADIISQHVESPGTKAYTPREVAGLFEGASRCEVTTEITAWDLRYGRRRFLPRALARVLPDGIGWFHVAEGRK